MMSSEMWIHDRLADSTVGLIQKVEFSPRPTVECAGAKLCKVQILLEGVMLAIIS